MALTLVATVGAANANSYATVVEGSAYHEAHLYASVWNAANDERKAQALVWATRLLDSQIDWFGVKASTTQALRWPRFAVEDADGQAIAADVIPQALKDATAELARTLLTTDPASTSGLAAGALKSLKVGPIALEYADGATTETDAIPDAVLSLVQAFGGLRSGASVSLSRV